MRVSNMILEIVNNLKYLVNRKILLRKYGLGESVIEIKNDFIYLRIGKKYRSKISIRNITDIIYNIDSEGYFFRVKAVGDSDNQFFFDRRYDIRYRAKDIKNFIAKVKDLNIKLTPDFGQYGAIYECQHDGIVQYCTTKNKYLLTLTRDKKNIIYVNHGTFDRYKYKTVYLDNLSLKNEMSFYGNETLKTKMHNASYGIYILDKSLTFERGFCLTSVDLSGCNNSPMVFGDEIFYSFDEDEIKNNIIELFEKYSSKRNP